MSLLALSGTNSVSGGYEIDNSLKFEADNTEYLSFSNSVGENRRTWTYSTWVKKTELFGAGSVGGTLFGAYLDSNDRARIEQYGDELGLHGKISGTTAVNVRTTMALRDTAAWYHCMVVLDTTQATETDRVKIYVNGVQETSMVATTYPPQNYQFAINNAVNHYVGQKGDGTDYFCGYMAETYFIDGQALTPTSFGEFDDDSGIWKPKEFTGTYPSADTNHFYLNFDDSSNLGKDSSGNGKNMTSNNITSADQATDTPTNNFATVNVIGNTRSGKFTYTEGGTKVVRAGSTDWDSWANTIAVGSGKWYAEFKMIGDTYHFVGVGSEEYYFVGNGSGTGFPEVYYGYSGTDSVGWYANNGDIYNNGSQSATDPTYGDGDIISVALDMDNGKVYFAKNGTWMESQNPATGANSIALPNTSARYFIGISHYQANLGAECNFGGYTSFSISSGNADSSGYGNFEYAVPTGYYALCTKNLAEFG